MNAVDRDDVYAARANRKLHLIESNCSRVKKLIKTAAKIRDFKKGNR